MIAWYANILKGANSSWSRDCLWYFFHVVCAYQAIMPHHRQWSLEELFPRSPAQKISFYYFMLCYNCCENSASLLQINFIEFFSYFIHECFLCKYWRKGRTLVVNNTWGVQNSKLLSLWLGIISINVQPIIFRLHNWCSYMK